MATVWRQYAESPVTRETAAADQGLSVEEFIARLRAIDPAKIRDPVVLTLLAGGQVNRAPYEASWQTISLECAR